MANLKARFPHDGRPDGLLPKPPAHRLRRWCHAALGALLLLAGCAGGWGRGGGEGPAHSTAAVSGEQEPTPAGQLAGRIDAVLADERFRDAHWGIHVESVDRGELLHSLNGDRLFMPASNQKILTAAAALGYLGPEFRFETTLTTTGTARDGVLDGDLVVRGNGDPTLSTRFHEDCRDLFRHWARELNDHGITHIAGRLIGDDTAWDDTRTGYGWPRHGAVNAYWAEFGPLQLNENTVVLVIQPPDAPGGEAVITSDPPTAHHDIRNRLEVVGEGESWITLERPVASNVITVSGQVRAGESPLRRRAAITDPAAYYLTVLRETMEEEGVTIAGGVAIASALTDWQHPEPAGSPIARHQSPPLAELLAVLYKDSQNLYAESLVSAMGWKRNGRGTVGGGRAVVVEEMAGLGVSADQFLFRDGSGLSRYNYVTPRALVAVLRAMLDGPHGSLWWESQALAGVDGTLRRRLTGTAGERNVRGKTGTISSVRALSGYVTTRGGELLVFACIVNAHQRSAREADELIDALVLLLADYDGSDGE